jgi:hypothetical protein
MTRGDWIAALIGVGVLAAGFVLYVLWLGSPVGIR